MKSMTISFLIFIFLFAGCKNEPLEQKTNRIASNLIENLSTKYEARSIFDRLMIKLRTLGEKNEKGKLISLANTSKSKEERMYYQLKFLMLDSSQHDPRVVSEIALNMRALKMKKEAKIFGKREKEIYRELTK